jgi:hypothetical protein
MALDTDDMRFALADARTRHEALIKIIADIDKQALSFLQQYVTLAGTALTGAGVILLTKAQPPPYPLALGWGLVGFAACLVIGSMFAMATIWTSPVNLPGRDPDFWQWADGHGVSVDSAYRAYLKNLAAKGAQNARLNERLSNLMTWSKLCGIAAPVVGAAVAWNAYYFV